MIGLTLEEVLDGLERHSFIFENEAHKKLIVFILSSIYAQAAKNRGGQK
ncbi:hypothetical protein [uncultured Enterobacter sp.]|nr:hypothetical protein [uncultured Enterobacter sp.]